MSTWESPWPTTTYQTAARRPRNSHGSPSRSPLIHRASGGIVAATICPAGDSVFRITRYRTGRRIWRRMHVRLKKLFEDYVNRGTRTSLQQHLDQREASATEQAHHQGFGCARAGLYHNNSWVESYPARVLSKACLA